ncbi:major facilitator superfamily transporter multidrug resistance [Grosmannia clavigera kw1407]|uniref:Major facilitator superfamily transporter multidrug resistance n=1 Tax=Grosmannia clavigera (strain kw1407 / UAMH 11150) TaxID=655863 RepID=F0XUF7_GROCL|nr:major facilitator superfamily transporter multidrug resistance [Grosmannia clavigera kw1407]EFW98402.1 major facilitator superfamily transporter multidrug resistance [Grosmannia clavigera kw1407]
MSSTEVVRSEAAASKEMEAVAVPNKSEHVEYGDEPVLSPEHQAYLMQRHGTTDLDPIPAMDDEDPLNWGQRKKIVNLVLVAFHAMMSTFTAASIQPSFVAIAADLDVSVQQASYLTSLQIAVLGGAPLFWRPFSQAYGRRPVFLLSLACSLVCNIGCAESRSYGTMGLCRALTAFFISPPLSIGSGVVSETFFRRDRGLYMGVWATMATLGVSVAPLIFGFVAYRVGYRWVYWVLAMLTVQINAGQLVLYLFLGPETRYIANRPHVEQTTPPSRPSSFVARYLRFGRIDHTPLRVADFVRPLAMALRPCVLIPAAAYAMVFLWGGILISLELPQLFPERFGQNAEQVGLQNVSLVIGTLLGEQLGGRMSDRWMWRRHRRGHFPAPEYRLWLSYVGYALVVCGVVIFLVQIDHAGHRWNVTPLIGAAIASAGNQIITTVLITYAVDCYRHEAASIGMLANIGLVRSLGIPLGLLVAVSLLPTMALQWKGHCWRKQPALA